MREVEEMGVTHGIFLRTYKRECQKGNSSTAVRLRTLSLSLSLSSLSLVSLSSLSLSLSLSYCGRALGLCAVCALACCVTMQRGAAKIGATHKFYIPKVITVV
jgi:hypothetical protein